MNTQLFYNYGRNPLLQKLVTHFKFNNNIADSTGFITSQTSSGIDYVSGKLGNAIRFDAQTDRVDIPANSLHSFVSGGNDIAFSINAWVYFMAFSSFGNWIVNKRTNTLGGDEWQFMTYPNKLCIYKNDKTTGGVAQSIIATTTLSTGQWYMVTATDNGSKTEAGMKLYVNGSQVATTSFSSGLYTGMTANNVANTRIGQAAWNTNNGTQHQGYIDSLSIWRGRELTAFEIGQLYNSGNGLDYVF